MCRNQSRKQRLKHCHQILLSVPVRSVLLLLHHHRAHPTTPTTTPRPTTTPTPGPSNTPTPEPSATPTPEPPGQSYCDYLRATPISGQVPLTVNFTGKGHDTEKVKGYRFTFGDGEKEEFLESFTSDHLQTASHTYDDSGTFTAKLEILDNGDHWRTTDQCKAMVTVTGGVTVAPTRTAQVNPTTVPQPTEVLLPEAGIKLPALGGMILGFLPISPGVVLVF